MRLTVISILSFLLIPAASAVEFTFDSPESVNLGEQFQVSLSSNSVGEYDVKVFVHNSSGPKIKQNEIISQIKNGDNWQDSWNYVKSAFPSQTIFNINIIGQPGDRNICVRLRKVNQSLFEELCKPISVDTNYEKDVNDGPEIIEKSEKNKIIEEYVEDKGTITPSIISENVINTDYNVKKPDEKIILNKKKTNQDETLYITKQEKSRLYLVYGFSVFCLIIIILLAMRKL